MDEWYSFDGGVDGVLLFRVSTSSGSLGYEFVSPKGIVSLVVLVCVGLLASCFWSVSLLLTYLVLVRIRTALPSGSPRHSTSLKSVFVLDHLNVDSPRHKRGFVFTIV